MPQPAGSLSHSAVVFDTNVYRGLSRAVVDCIHDAEGHRDIVAYANPWTIRELLSHIADPLDTEYGKCKSALRVLWTHCAENVEGVSRLRVISDTDAQLCRLLFNVTIANRSEQFALHEYLVRRVLESTDHADLVDVQPSLLEIAQRCASVEAAFADDLSTFLVKAIASTAGIAEQDADWRTIHESPSLRNDVLAFCNANKGYYDVACAFAVRAANEGNVQLTPDLLDEAARAILRSFPTPVELYNEVVRRIALNATDMTISKNANSIWDIQISFVASDTMAIAGRPVLLVTNERMILEAARQCGQGNHIMDIREYKTLLGC